MAMIKSQKRIPVRYLPKTVGVIGIWALSLLAAWAHQASGTADQPDPAEGTVWDLSPLFANKAAWDAEKEQVEAALPGLAALRGTLGKNPQSLQAGLDQISAMRLRVEKLAAYATLVGWADSRPAENQALQQSASTIKGEFEEATSFVKPEILAIGRTKIEAMERQNPGLACHKRPLELILRTQAHTLTPEGESVLAASKPLRDQPQTIYNLLLNTGIQFTVEPTNSSPDRALRRKNEEGFFEILKRFEGSVGAILAAHLAGSSFEAKARHYPSSVTMMLDADGMSEKPFRAMVAGAQQGAQAERRYIALRKETLHLDETHTYDLSVPLQTSTPHYTLTEAEELILKALAPLGEDYVRDLREGFHSHRMHAVAQPGKSSGAMTDGAYGNGYFVLLSYNGRLSSVSTMAHEWGHAMHAQMAARAQPYEAADFSRFIADTPSLLNELLLSDYMVAHAKTRAEKIAALLQEISLVRLSYFHVGLTAQLEVAAHDAIDRGEPLTGARLSKMYCDVLRGWYGDSVKVADNYCANWVDAPPLYYDFYMYKYMIATSAAAYFTEGIERGDHAMRDRLFELLRAGSSDDVLVLLRRAGFDAESESSYLAMGRRLDRLVTELEATLKQPA